MEFFMFAMLCFAVSMASIKALSPECEEESPPIEIVEEIEDGEFYVTIDKCPLLWEHR